MAKRANYLDIDEKVLAENEQVEKLKNDKESPHQYDDLNDEHSHGPGLLPPDIYAQKKDTSGNGGK